METPVMTGEYAAGARVATYSGVAACTFLLYDVMLTFQDEVQLIWPQPWCLPKFIFLFIRYFTVAVQISTQFGSTTKLRPRECHALMAYEAVAAMLVLCSVDYILLARVHALYIHMPLVKYLTASLFVAEIVVVLTSLIIALSTSKFDDHCVLVEAPPVSLIASIPVVVFQTALFVATIWRCFSVVRAAGWKQVRLTTVLMRDGTWTFVLVFVFLLFACILNGIATNALSDLLYG
ncbi:hypothetical protein CC2G_006443 [Coprinopsis cinerea AmutBmut pab1-1]|nr:hypothetical protein CC2G_006443 [Coprinopsis cinerea AmutBmut pab1-1]